MSTAEIGLVLALIVEGGAVIWAASRLNTTVASLERLVSKIDSDMDELKDDVSTHGGRLAVLESYRRAVR